MNTTTEYQKFLDSVVKDAFASAREMGISPSEALQHIMECIHEDAAEKLDQADDNDFSI